MQSNLIHVLLGESARYNCKSCNSKKRQLFFCTLRGEKYRKAIEEDVTDKIGQVTSMRDALRACLDNVKAHMSIYHR